jgi:hypothetical protein
MWLVGTQAPAHHGRDQGGIVLSKTLPNVHETPCDARECQR